MKKSTKLIDLTGQRFGRWLVESYAGGRPQGGARWLCRCDCGSERAVDGVALRSGKSASCGCTIPEVTSARARVHGKSRSGGRLYYIWGNMRRRCNSDASKSFANYGGRGIKVCSAWNEFGAFEKWALESGYAPELTLERVNNDGNYCPENCTWATRASQNRNRRNNRGPEPGVIWLDQARERGLSASAFWTRVRRGWSPQAAATTPPLRAGRRVSADEWQSRR